jgi:hypothetical protein
MGHRYSSEGGQVAGQAIVRMALDLEGVRHGRPA